MSSQRVLRNLRCIARYGVCTAKYRVGAQRTVRMRLYTLQCRIYTVQSGKRLYKAVFTPQKCYVHWIWRCVHCILRYLHCAPRGQWWLTQGARVLHKLLLPTVSICPGENCNSNGKRFLIKIAISPRGEYFSPNEVYFWIHVLWNSSQLATRSQWLKQALPWDWSGKKLCIWVKFASRIQTYWNYVTKI